jgi:hypothetical protein
MTRRDRGGKRRGGPWRKGHSQSAVQLLFLLVIADCGGGSGGKQDRSIEGGKATRVSSVAAQSAADSVCRDLSNLRPRSEHARVRLVEDTLVNVGLAADNNPVPACEVILADSTYFLSASASNDTSRIRPDYWMGWLPLSRLDADGPDGSVSAFERGRVRCLVDKSWDGGDDADSTYKPLPWYREATTCWLRQPKLRR